MFFSDSESIGYFSYPFANPKSNCGLYGSLENKIFFKSVHCLSVKCAFLTNSHIY